MLCVCEILNKIIIYVLLKEVYLCLIICLIRVFSYILAQAASKVVKRSEPKKSNNQRIKNSAFSVLVNY